MKKSVLTLALLSAFATAGRAQSAAAGKAYASADYTPKKATVNYLPELETLVFEFQVAGSAGKTQPRPAGKTDGAPVLGYVFPTTLKSTDIGMAATEGIVALALTSHPDFEDTPLWDENGDGDYNNDGLVWHAHWVVLIKDSRVAGGFSVKEFGAMKAMAGMDNMSPAAAPKMPPTSTPGMGMYMDSPGFTVTMKGNTGRAVVPLDRINHRRDFKFDLVTCYMEVNASDKNRPMLGVYQVYGVMSGNLSLPYTVAAK
ncbi:hypothetical protein [Hymenobacter sp. IS2118]|uniref:hypothetical protein n=1 Tax=Hymenobacter sp. IS2118 TaxID=1505605 RepID=UPI0005542047|nr:hypothetical protein [Hymenobacter sp. IS2118]